MNTERQERVELHCHTRMSEMDGVTDIRDLLDQAIMFGHRAVAITDHGSVQAFIQAYYEMQEIQDTYVDPGESLDFKLLYGMEAYLADNIRKYVVVMIAASEEGRINLYRLISASAPVSRDRDLCISKSNFLAYRDGLLIGSVSPTGEVYQAVLSGRPEEELAQLVTFYDYLEIQPDCCIDFLWESGNPSEQRYSAEELHDMNKKIVELGEKYKKPVVATGNVHFLDPEDVIYRKIIKAANDEAAPGSDAPLFLGQQKKCLRNLRIWARKRRKKWLLPIPI